MDKKYNLPDDFISLPNIAEKMDEDELQRLGSSLKEQVQSDIDSRSEWLEKNDKWMELVTQVLDEKSYPWPNASNIKFPLISTAAIQFHARAFPALLGNNKPVKAKIIGRDPDGMKAARAERVSTLMSYQVLEQMDGWVDDMDRLLFLVPIVGSLYKKSYHSETKKRNVSDLINPRDFIINYDALEVKDARKTHRIWELPNTIVSKQRRGLYRTFDGDDVYQPTQTRSHTGDKIHGASNPGKLDDYALQEHWEVHVLLDLDDDGYKEPYIVTLREADGAVFRVAANYNKELMEYEGDTLVEIHAKEYFTHFFFLPDPESKTHGLGFGSMVGPINEAVNTILNQLTDSGHINTLGGGFLSRGIRVKGGALKFKPGEWKTINATGDDLRKGILPLPTKEPSNVLFQLLGLLIDSGKDLSSVQDIMVGKNPGQNQPFSTSKEVIQQGMKVFNGIYKRLYRSLTSEFKKLYKLNQDHPDIETYKNVLDAAGQDVQAAEEKFGTDKVLGMLSRDFAAKDIDIIPTAEPDMILEMQKAARGQSLLEKLSMGMKLNMQEVTKRILEAEGHEDIALLMQVQDTGPPPKIKLEIEQFEHQKKVDQMELTLKEMKTRAEVDHLASDTELKLAQAEEASLEGIHAQFIAQKKQTQEEFENVTKRLKVLIDGRKNDIAGKQADRTFGASQRK